MESGVSSEAMSKREDLLRVLVEAVTEFDQVDSHQTGD